MNDQETTREQLLAQVQELQQRIADLEKTSPGETVEEALLESEERFRIIFEYAPDAVYLNDMKGNFIDGNRAAEALTGFSRKELIGKNFLKLKLLPVAQLPKAAKCLAKNVLGKATEPDEFVLNRKDGSAVRVEISTYPTRIKGRRVVLGIARDITERKQAEEALKRNQYYLTKAQEIGLIGTWELDLRKNILIWTDENYRIFGVPQGTQMDYELFLSRIHPDDRDYVHEQWSAALDNKPYDIEHRLLVDGKVKWVREKADIEFDGDGKAVMAIGVTQDITERKEAEEALRDSRKQLWLFIDSSPDLCFFKDRAGKYLMVNTANAQFFAKKEAEIIGKTDFELMPEEQAQGCSESDTRAMEERTMVVDVESSGGKVYETRKIPVISDEDDVVGVVGIIRDITEQKHTEEALQESEEKYRTLTESMADGMFSLDLKGNFSYLSPAFERITGYKIDDFLGQSFTKILAPEHIQLAVDNFKRGLMGEKVPLYDIELLRRDGMRIPIELNMTTLYDSKGQVVGRLGISRDITKRKQAEKALKESQENLLQAQYIAGIGDFTWDVRSGETSWSAGMYRLLKYDRDEIIDYENVNNNIHHPDDLERVTKWLMDSIASGKEKLVPNEYRLVCKDGEVIFVQTNGRIEYTDGKAVKLFGTCLDITERKQAEEALKETEERFRTVVEQSTMAIEIYEPDGKMLSVNNAWERFWGLKKEAVANFNILGDKECERTGLTSAFKEAQQGRSQILPELQYDAEESGLTGGPKRWISAKMYPILDKNGEVQNIVLTYDNITERKKAETALKESEKALIQAQTIAQIGSWEMNTITKKLVWSKQMYHILEISPDEEPTFELFYSRVHLDDLEYVQEIGTKVYEDNKAAQAEYRLLTPSGITKHIATEGRQFLDENNTVIKLTGIVQDITERKNAEEALRESENRLNIIFESAPDTYYLNDFEGRFIAGNKAAEELLGYPREELIGKTFVEAGILSVDQVEKAINVLTENIKGNSTGPDEYALIRKDGTTVDVEILTHPVKIAGEGRVLGIARNITERKKATEALRKSEEKFRLMLMNSPDMVMLQDLDGRTTYISPQSYEILGYSPEEAKEMNVFDSIHPDDLERVQEGFQKALGGQELIHVVYRYIDRDKKTVWLDHTARPILMDGKLTGIQSTVRDISERKKATEALCESEERFRDLAQMLPEAIFETDKDVNLTYANLKAFEMFGYTKEDFKRGLNSLDMITPYDRKRAGENIVKRMKGEEFGTIEYTAIRKNGSVFPVLLHMSPMTTENGVVGFRGIIVDITERKRAEEQRLHLERQVQHAQKLKSLGVLAGGIAHDFNNLLMGMLGNADLALSELSPLSPARESIRNIETAAMRAAELSKQMLAYSGKGKFVIEDIAINALINEMIHLLKVSKSRNVVLNYNLANNLPAVSADATQLRQVVMNLITNASEAIGKKSGVVSISTGVMECDREFLSGTYLDEDLPEGPYVFVEISDTGCGMDKETIARIFDPFFTTKFTGRGLGMAAVLGIIRGHKATIQVTSEPGKGTTITVFFPALEHSIGPGKEKEASEEEDWTIDGTVLIVDDEKTVLVVGKAMLKKYGIPVLTAEDGRLALEVFREHKDEISCVVLDLTMPHMDGEETFRELRRIRGDVKVILSSGYNEQEVTERFNVKELAGFIQKPYRREDLMKALHRAVEGEESVEGEK